MQQISQEERRYRWIGVAVAGAALIGWLFGLYFWSVANEAEDRLAQQVTLEQTAQDLTSQIAALRDEAEEAIAVRDQVIGALAGVEQQLEQARSETAALDAETTALQAERDTMQTALDEGRAELAQIETGLGETQTRITESTQELSTIGERLEAARQQEADLQGIIADLSAEASQLSQDAAGAEERVQAARDAEASLEQRLQTAQTEQAEMTATRDTLRQSVDTLTQQQDTLASDTLAAEEQLQALQDMTSELSQVLVTRSAQLRAVEDRIGRMLESTGATIRASASGVATDTPYTYGSTRLLFLTDGTFAMTNTRTEKGVTGAFDLSEGIITLRDVDGDLGAATFPMHCGFTVADAELTLADSDGSCAILDGVAFTQGDGE
ncbi:hypothetical protein [Yoonia vestfoldensis]|uniref:hypothetical protein n=1 Tax=Yoonia vestfoldensis TaxID=245188 RepID=UPI000371F437|nr:hypothetical protein [Yoonia vestfoldensis]